MDSSMARMRTPGHCVSDQVKFQPATGEKHMLWKI